MALVGTDTEVWVKFFRDAGIPAAIAADYAITFNNNRIQKNMLLDLNKEILKDMGICPMGDVIAILRHAKAVHDKLARARILSVELESKKSSSRSQKENTLQPQISIESPSRNRKHGSSRALPKQSALSSPVPQNEGRLSVGKKRTVPIEVENVRQREVQSPMEVEEVEVLPTPPTKKTRRVLPEHEGGYRITMPSGSTPRSRAILSMGYTTAKEDVLEYVSATARQSQQKQRGTVFDRLGECVVSSTTGTSSPAEERSNAATTTLTVTTVNRGSPSKDGSSVFSRLGNKAQMNLKQTAVTVRLPKTMGSSSGQLEYAGVLKKQVRSPAAVAALSKKNGTMRADEQTGNAKERLGIKRIKKDGIVAEPTVIRRILSKTGKASAGILGNPENAAARSVKTRLGVTIPGNKPIKQRITAPVSDDKPTPRFFSAGFRPRGTGAFRGRGWGGRGTFFGRR